MVNRTYMEHMWNGMNRLHPPPEHNKNTAFQQLEGRAEVVTGNDSLEADAERHGPEKNRGIDCHEKSGALLPVLALDPDHRPVAVAIEEGLKQDEHVQPRHDEQELQYAIAHNATLPAHP